MFFVRIAGAMPRANNPPMQAITAAMRAARLASPMVGRRFMGQAPAGRILGDDDLNGKRVSPSLNWVGNERFTRIFRFEVRFPAGSVGM